ncbi:MAG: 4-hydroxyphenylpyruvate dioxygenase [Bdellovibrionaceae bacterium]|nr:4-hydroxyphenylpyruvate dioxygenase [Pseudobdellovibrionaceae bacterium]MDW8189879.1 4-hydroxyphenylpyruvate dioxygenase [Pseudobdellovibrionaceae bacterium]
MTNSENPVGLDGVRFVEFSGSLDFFDPLFQRLGFTSIATNKELGLTLYRQGDIDFLVNTARDSYAHRFFQLHGPSLSGMGFRVADQERAFAVVAQRGIQQMPEGYRYLPFPKLSGIGESCVYLVDDGSCEEWYQKIFGVTLKNPQVSGAGFIKVDHFTNNVPRGQMDQWCQFYQRVFNFKETRYFHIRGKKTGLESRVMRSPCGQFSIPINEPTEEKSQIQEFLDEYKGSGVQHLALLTNDIIRTMDMMKKNAVPFLAPPPATYYRALKQRVPLCTEDIRTLETYGLLVDGDEHGYLLQIFTKNLIGPIFFEMIQRKNHLGFGEGNFQALFDSIEQDQFERGYLTREEYV